jgi:hypothetical protein
MQSTGCPFLVALGFLYGRRQRDGLYGVQIFHFPKWVELAGAHQNRFVINRKTAKELDLTIPDKLLATADEMIK